MITPLRRRAAAVLALPLLGVSLASCSTVPAAHLEVGDCLDSATLRNANDMVGRVTVVECDEEHDTEVVGVYEVPGEDYPGPDALNEIAGTECTASFREYVGVDYQLSELELVPLIPSEKGWEADDHRMVCIATAPEPFTGSVEGTGR